MGHILLKSAVSPGPKPRPYPGALVAGVRIADRSLRPWRSPPSALGPISTRNFPCAQVEQRLWALVFI